MIGRALFLWPYGSVLLLLIFVIGLLFAFLDRFGMALQQAGFLRMAPPQG